MEGLICNSPETGEIILLGEGDESLPEEYPQSDEGEDGTLTLKGETLEVSIVFSL